MGSYLVEAPPHCTAHHAGGTTDRVAPFPAPGRHRQTVVPPYHPDLTPQVDSWLGPRRTACHASSHQNR